MTLLAPAGRSFASWWHERATPQQRQTLVDAVRGRGPIPTGVARDLIEDDVWLVGTAITGTGTDSAPGCTFQLSAEMYDVISGELRLD